MVRFFERRLDPFDQAGPPRRRSGSGPPPLGGGLVPGSCPSSSGGTGGTPLSRSALASARALAQLSPPPLAPKPLAVYHVCAAGAALYRSNEEMAVGFTGTATGRTYNVGQSYTSAGRVYTAQADGTFVREDGHRTVGSSYALMNGTSQYTGTGGRAPLGTPLAASEQARLEAFNAWAATQPRKGSATRPKVRTPIAPIPRARNERPGGQGLPDDIRPVLPPVPRSRPNSPTSGPGSGVVTKPGSNFGSGVGNPKASNGRRGNRYEGAGAYDQYFGRQAPLTPVGRGPKFVDDDGGIAEFIIRAPGTLEPKDPGYSIMFPPGTSSMSGFQTQLDEDSIFGSIVLAQRDWGTMQYNRARNDAEYAYQREYQMRKGNELFTGFVNDQVSGMKSAVKVYGNPLTFGANTGPGFGDGAGWVHKEHGKGSSW